MDAINSALASPRRLEILEALLAHPGATQKKLMEALRIPMKQRGTLSKDVSALEEAGLLVGDQGSRWSLAFPDLTAQALQGLADLDREVAAVRAESAAERSRRLQEATRDLSPSAPVNR